jgi:hypothetical protein
VQSIRHRDFDAAFVTAHCKTLPSGTLEQQLLADGLEPELRAILQSFGRADALTEIRHWPLRFHPFACLQHVPDPCT